MPARVVVVEPMGSETQVMMRIGETAVNGVFRERINARPGDTLPVTPQSSLAHLFSKQTGERL
jgi:multiple sugar transport system ATP-binding protein